jgi:hypothetical protein
MVLDNCWRFIEYYLNRTVNIVGLDETEARKYGCPLGTAVSVVKDSTGAEYLMVAHEAVQKESSRTSLLSEGQMQHYGLIVDYTLKRHRGIDGLPGTQSIYSPEKSIQFHMIQRDALMALPHHATTDYKIPTLPRFIMTDVTPWSPTLLHDDDDTTTLLEHDVLVPLTPGDTQAFHSVHHPHNPPKETRWTFRPLFGCSINMYLSLKRFLHNPLRFVLRNRGPTPR